MAIIFCGVLKRKFSSVATKCNPRVKPKDEMNLQKHHSKLLLVRSIKLPQVPLAIVK